MKNNKALMAQTGRNLSVVRSEIKKREKRLDELTENMFFGMKMISRHEETDASLKAELDAIKSEAKALKQEIGQLKSSETKLKQAQKNLLRKKCRE